MTRLRRHRARIAVTLLPVLLALLHATGVWRVPLVERLDHFIYDARLRATMPGTPDSRIVIVDIDDVSLQQWGQWPWSRDKLARLATELTTRQQAAVIGFDVVFAEPDHSAGLETLQQLARGPLRGNTGFEAELQQLAPALDRDAAFARALAGQPVALGYYFTRTEAPRAKGRLPTPLLPPDALPPNGTYATQWNGYGANLEALAAAAPRAGFINSVIEANDDGVIRATPLLARYDAPDKASDGAPSGYYESLSLAVYRLASGADSVRPVLAQGAKPPPPLEALVVGRGAGRIVVPVDSQAGVLVPFRGNGGPDGGSFRYIPAGDVLAGRLAPAELRGKIVMVGATAPGLQDLRATPVSATYPGIEVHANVVSGLLDGRMLTVPDYAPGYDVAMLVMAGAVLAIGLSLLSAPPAALLAIATAAVLVGLNAWLHAQARLVMPLAAALMMVSLAFGINMSWGYFVEERGRRGLARLFGTYVPPQLVDEMLERPHLYSMRAESKELTVMFCDMRGFTRLSEQMAPVELQAFLNEVFSRLTEIISLRRGTIDKYMGDCVMAFWGAPVSMPGHAALAVQAAVEMAAAVREINAAHLARGLPGISVGIGLNTGVMSVGDMGSAVRRSYTVVGDAVNLAARLEGLSGHYGVEIVANRSTQQSAPAYIWQELDQVRVKGKEQVVTIFTPLAAAGQQTVALREELEAWAAFLLAYRAQDFAAAKAALAPLVARSAKKFLYRLYTERLASMALQPKIQNWDGATRFETK